MAKRVNVLERALRRVDRFQQRHTVLAFPFAVVKKFGDDQAGRLAALIAYYGFFSLFPLLLIFVSVLGFVLSGHPGLRDSIVDSALGTFPVIGTQLRARSGVATLQGSVVSIVFGGVTAIYAGLRVAQAAQTAMNTVWDIPRAQWPNFVFRRVRALLVLLLLGVIIVASTFVNGLGTSGAIGSYWLYLSLVGSLALNFALFMLTFQILTARDLHWPHVLPGAALAAVLWTGLQSLGSLYVTRELDNASDVYGSFALVFALLIWIALGAQVTLFCAEINVVRNRRLWPRSVIQPPLTEGDQRVYEAIVVRNRMRPEVAVKVWFTDNHEKGAAGRDGALVPRRSDHE
jgi:YihY family inner membrane protein